MKNISAYQNPELDVIALGSVDVVTFSIIEDNDPYEGEIDGENTGLA